MRVYQNQVTYTGKPEVGFREAMPIPHDRAIGPH